MSTREVDRTGSNVYIEATVTADVTLDAQTVTLSVDGGTTWLAATWLGSAGTTRTARTSSPVLASTTFPAPGVYPLKSKVSDGTETEVTHHGGIVVR